MEVIDNVLEDVRTGMEVKTLSVYRSLERKLTAADSRVSFPFTVAVTVVL